MPHYQYVLLAVLGFGFIVFIHELGHFVAAKLFGVKATAFSLGFPPTLLHKQIGETDYRLGAVVFGGYVSMVGEDPTEQTDDPRALSNARPWKRAVIFAAGVTMNIISAMVIYMIASFVGIEVTPPVAAEAAKGSPAYVAGIQPGDRVLSIDGRRIETFDDIRFTVMLGALNDEGHEFRLVVRREGQEKPVEILVKAERNGEAGLPAIGLEPPFRPIVAKIKENSPAWQMGLRNGDWIVSVSGSATPFGEQFNDAMAVWPTRSFDIIVRRDDVARSTTVFSELHVDPAKIREPDYGFYSPISVDKVTPGSAAEQAGVAAGDYVLAAGEVKYPTAAQFEEATSGSNGGPVKFVLRHGDQTKTVEVAPRLDKTAQRYRIGVLLNSLGADADGPVVLERLGQGGAASAAGIPDGAVITAINGQGGKLWKHLTWTKFLEKLNAETVWGKAVEITYRVGAGEPKTVTVTPGTVEPKLFGGFAFTESLRERLPPTYNPLKALNIGLRKVKRTVILQYVSVKALVSREVATDQLMGPVRIGILLYTVAEHGASDYFMFLGLISVLIALLNIMPVPPLDGGHLMFLVVEKVIGRPVPVKVRYVVTVIGLAALLSLIGLAFYNDIIWTWKQYF
jgi:regulator of sigma E protease